MAQSQGLSVKELAAQIGTTLLPDNETWTNRFQIRSTSSSALYTIAQRRNDGVWGCSCPGWRHYRKCKHVKDVLRRLTTVAAQPAFVCETPVMRMLASARTAYLDLAEPTTKIATPFFRHRVLDL